MKKFLFNYIFPYILYVPIFIWCRTLRVSRKNAEAEDYVRNLPGKYILTLWHGRIFYLFYYLRNRPDFHLLISPSQDGDLLARLALLMGYSVIRGSTYKKAVSSARALIKVLRRDERIIIIADGSRGPRIKAQSGSIQLAGITDAPLIPMTFGAKCKIELNSWDRFVIPLPFTQCSVNFGHPIPVPHRPDEESLRKKQDELERALNQLSEESE
ncbi:MAG: lysophospholipid acyltransferase family protein [Nitrospinae bacterium]|nr:lysophospholipid acyltransferase family protein [Nitrospinota bacterium]